MATGRGDEPAESTRVRVRGGQVCPRGREAGGQRKRGQRALSGSQ